MLREAKLEVRERGDGAIDGVSMVEALGSLIAISQQAWHVPSEPHVPASDPTLSDRVAYLEGRLEHLENLTAVPNKVEGSA